MIQNVKSIFKYKDTKTVLFLFVLFTVWRIALLFISNSGHINLSPGSIFWWGGFYQLIAIAGGFLGLVIGRQWGGFKSVIGRAISFVSLGLLLQAFGQSVATYYVYINSSIYPSIADVGFFGSVLAYICGIFMLARATGVRVSLKTFSGKIIAFILPLILLIASYFVFLKGYQFDWSGWLNKIRVILDFGYPLGQALYVSVALLTLTLSRKFLGGIMKMPIIFILGAFIFQYLSDYAFLYTSSRGIYVAGGFVDVMYMISYFVMSLAILQLGSVFEKIKNS